MRVGIVSKIRLVNTNIALSVYTLQGFCNCAAVETIARVAAVLLCMHHVCMPAEIAFARNTLCSDPS